jgi:putative tricarboxylic transport membrane protein
MSPDKSKEANQQGVIGQRANQLFALLWIVTGVVILVQSWDLNYVGEYGPGPGFLPLWMGIGITVLGLALLAQLTFSRKEREGVSLPNKHAAWQMFLVMFGFFAFVFFADKIGFLLGIGLMFFFILTAVERKEWKFSLAIAIGMTLLFWAIFELGLELRLPMGFFDLLE